MNTLVNLMDIYLAMLLAPGVCIVKNSLPRRVLEVPIRWLPRPLPYLCAPFGMRHHRQVSSVLGANARDAVYTAVWIHGIRFSRITMIIRIPVIGYKKYVKHSCEIFRTWSICFILNSTKRSCKIYLIGKQLFPSRACKTSLRKVNLPSPWAIHIPSTLPSIPFNMIEGEFSILTVLHLHSNLSERLWSR